jgi:hypothetical protein
MPLNFAFLWIENRQPDSKFQKRKSLDALFVAWKSHQDPGTLAGGAAALQTKVDQI